SASISQCARRSRKPADRRTKTGFRRCLPELPRRLCVRISLNRHRRRINRKCFKNTQFVFLCANLTFQRKERTLGFKIYVLRVFYERSSLTFGFPFARKKTEHARSPRWHHRPARALFSRKHRYRKVSSRRGFGDRQNARCRPL